VKEEIREETNNDRTAEDKKEERGEREKTHSCLCIKLLRNKAIGL